MFDGKIRVDVYGRFYEGEERTAFSKDSISIDDAIEYLQKLKEKYPDRV